VSAVHVDITPAGVYVRNADSVVSEDTLRIDVFKNGSFVRGFRLDPGALALVAEIVDRARQPSVAIVADRFEVAQPPTPRGTRPIDLEE